MLTVWDRIRLLRKVRGETGEQFGGRIGLSKGKVSELEAGKYAPSVQTALAIEALSARRIDAAELSDEVRLARHGITASPASGDGSDSLAQSGPSSGKMRQISQAARA